MSKVTPFPLKLHGDRDDDDDSNDGDDGNYDGDRDDDDDSNDGDDGKLNLKMILHNLNTNVCLY